jgi:signal transduction histidine kinase
LQHAPIRGITGTDSPYEWGQVGEQVNLYPFIYDMSGKCVAHGARPALIGKNLIDLKDQDGKFLIREMVAISKGPGRGWVDYKWPNPLTNKIEDKSSYIEKMGDYFVGVGVYKQ